MKQLLKYALLIACVFMCYGCTLFWTDHAFIITIAKNIDADGLVFTADPNSTRIGSGQSTTSNDKIKMINPAVGIVETH